MDEDLDSEEDFVLFEADDGDEDEPLDPMSLAELTDILEDIPARFGGQPIQDPARLLNHRLDFGKTTDETLFDHTMHVLEQGRPHDRYVLRAPPEVLMNLDADGVFGHTLFSRLDRCVIGKDISILRDSSVGRLNRSKHSIPVNGQLVKVSSMDCLPLATIPFAGKTATVSLLWGQRLNAAQKAQANGLVGLTVKEFVCSCAADCTGRFFWERSHVPVGHPSRFNLALPLSSSTWPCFARTLIAKMRQQNLAQHAFVFFSVCDTKTSLPVDDVGANSVVVEIAKVIRPEHFSHLEVDLAMSLMLKSDHGALSLFWSRQFLSEIIQGRRALYPQLMAGDICNGQVNHRHLDEEGSIRGMLQYSIIY